MKSIEEIDINNPEPFDGLVLQLLLDREIVVTDESKFMAMEEKQRHQVERWLAARHLSASDHVMTKKQLTQPEFSRDFIKNGKD